MYIIPIRSNKNNGDTSPLAELNEIPSSNEQVIPNGNQPSDTKPKRKLYLKDSFDNPLSTSDTQDLNTAIDRVTSDSEFEKTVLKKKNPKGLTETNPLISDEGKPSKKDKSELNLSGKKEKKGKLIPLDGNE